MTPKKQQQIQLVVPFFENQRLGSFQFSFPTSRSDRRVEARDETNPSRSLRAGHPLARGAEAEIGLRASRVFFRELGKAWRRASRVLVQNQ